MFTAIALDADNHLFDATYAIVASNNNDQRLWFITELHHSLGGLFYNNVILEPKFTVCCAKGV